MTTSYNKYTHPIKFDNRFHKLSNDDIGDILIDFLDIGFEIKTLTKGYIDIRDNEYTESESTKELIYVSHDHNYKLAYDISLILEIDPNTRKSSEMISKAALALFNLQTKQIRKISNLHTNMEIMDYYTLIGNYSFDCEFDEPESNDNDFYQKNLIHISVTMVEEFNNFIESDKQKRAWQVIDNILTSVLNVDLYHIHKNDKLYLHTTQQNCEILEKILTNIEWVKDYHYINDNASIRSFIDASHSKYHQSGPLVEISYDDFDINCFDQETELIDFCKFTDFLMFGKYLIVSDNRLSMCIEYICDRFPKSSYKLIDVKTNRFYIFEILD